MYCKNCQARPTGHVLTPVNPPVIDNRSSASENRLSLRAVRTTRERRVFLHYVWYKPTVPRARPRPFRFPKGSVADKGHSYAGCSQIMVSPTPTVVCRLPIRLDLSILNYPWGQPPSFPQGVHPRWWSATKVSFIIKSLIWRRGFFVSQTLILPWHGELSLSFSSGCLNISLMFKKRKNAPFVNIFICVWNS